MKYLKTYEVKEKFWVVMVKKNRIDKLEELINMLKIHKISFKLYDASNSDRKRNKKYYYLISKYPIHNLTDVNSYADYIENYGDELDYDVIVNTNKYNI